MYLNLVLLVAFVEIGLGNGSFQHKLRSDLFQNYDKFSLPASSLLDTVTVEVQFTIQLLHVNDKEESLDSTIWVKMNWNDPRLGWSQSDYSNISSIIVDCDHIWKPDFVLYNKAKFQHFTTFEASGAIIYEDGRILWVPPATISSVCLMDMTYWPYDTHVCKAKFGSWTRHGHTLDFKLDSDKIEFETPSSYRLNDLMPNTNYQSDWNVLSSKMIKEEIYYECCSEPYISISLVLTLARNGSKMAYTVLAPSVALGFLMVVMFLLPPCSGEKVFIGGVGLILNVLFSQHISDLVQSKSSTTPIILKFLTWQFFLFLTSLVISSLTLCASKKSSYKIPLPKCLRLLLNFFGYKETSDEEKVHDIEDWNKIAIAFNKIFLVIYFIIFVVYFITCLCYINTDGYINYTKY